MTATRARLPVGIGLVLGVAVALQPKLVVVALAGLGLAVAGVVHPPVLVGLMFVGMLFDRLGVTGMSVDRFPITASKLTVLASLPLWGLHAIIRGAPPVRWHPVLSALVAMVAVTGVGIAWANSMGEGRFQLFGLAMMTVMVALVYAALAGSALASLYRLMALAFVGVLAMSAAAASGGRSTGTMGDPNEWATTVLLVSPLLLGGLADDASALARPLRMALVTLAPVAVLLSGSRTALVVGCAISPACLYLLRRHRGELAACAAAAVVALPLLGDLDTALVRLDHLMQNLRGGAAQPDESLAERTELLRQGTQLFLDHWFIGAGPGNFASATGFLSRTGTLRPAHNTFLEIASEQGLVGLFPLALFLLTVALSFRRGLRDATTVASRSRVLGAMVGLGAVGLMAATLGLLTFSMAYLVLGVGLAVVHQARDGSAC